MGVLLIYAAFIIPVFWLATFLVYKIIRRRDHEIFSIKIKSLFILAGLFSTIALTYLIVASISDDGNQWGQFAKMVSGTIFIPMCAGILLMLNNIFIKSSQHTTYFRTFLDYSSIGAFQAVWVIPVLFISHLSMADYYRNRIWPSDYKSFVENLALKNGCENVIRFKVKDKKWNYRVYEISCSSKDLVFECEFDKKIPCYLK